MLDLLLKWAPTVLIVAIVLTAVFFAVRAMIKRKSIGGCCGNCRGCAYSQSCNQKPKDTDNMK